MSTSGATLVPARPRETGIDATKVVAAALVLFQHVTGALASRALAPAALVFVNALSWSAVPIFFAASGALFGRRVAGPGFDRREWAARRLRRILLPYAAWSAIYLVRARLLAGTDIKVDWVGVIFRGGAFYTLWFLPVLVWVTVSTVLLARDRRSLARLAGAAALLTVAGVALPREVVARVPELLALALWLAPNLAVFSASAWLGAGGELQVPRRVLAGAALACVLVSGSLAVVAASHPWYPSLRAGALAFAEVVAVLVIALALGSRAPSRPAISRLAALAFGFYLVQGGVLETFIRHVRITALPPVEWMALALAVTGLISAAICGLLYSVRLLRWLVS